MRELVLIFQGILLFYFDSWKIYHHIISTESHSILPHCPGTHLSGMSVCLQSFKGDNHQKSRKVQELPFLLGILIYCLSYLHATCSRQLMQTLTFLKAPISLCVHCWLESICCISLLANRQGDVLQTQNIIQINVKNNNNKQTKNISGNVIESDSVQEHLAQVGRKLKQFRSEVIRV